MGVLGSRLDPVSDAHRANRAANLELLAQEPSPLAGGVIYVAVHASVRCRGP
jgi:hypothetical protein